MPPRYFLRCLGSPELRGPTGEPIRIRTRKHFALLIYLAVEPRQHHRRERLADLLWPSASLSEARHSLATALSMIRGKLGPRSYESTRDTVKLITPEIDLDLDRLLRGDVLGDDFTPPLEMGGFLDDFEIPTSAEFMHWRDQRRAQLFPTIRSGFVSLMDRRRRTGAFAAIEPLADRLLELDPLSEEAIRAKMEGRAFAGDRISALRIYQEWKGRLYSELGATPSSLVDGMALRLRQRGYESPGVGHIPKVQTDQWRDRAFIGRAVEYKSLYECWEATKAGRGSHALVLGDSGIGKTTILERLLTAIGLEGAVYSRVQCYEAEREIPYATVGSLVRGLIEQPGSSTTPPEWLAELASTTSAVSQKFSNLPPGRDSAGETARLRIAEGVHQLALSVAEEHPLILVVDDVHLADDASVAILHLVMRRAQSTRIMIVMSARSQELKQSPNANRLIEARHSLKLKTIEIPALTDVEMDLLIQALGTSSAAMVPTAVRRSLVRSSAGIPMILELMFDDWKEHGDRSLALSVGAMTEGSTLGCANQLADQVYERVIRGLSDLGKTCLSMAALLGERLNDFQMYELVDLSLAQTLNGMTELVERRVLRDGGKGLEFRNELLRSKAYFTVPAPLRRSFHGMIADRLIAASRAGEPVSGLTLAWHCYRAGNQRQGAEYLVRGATEAIRRGALFEVELALSSALPSLEGNDLVEAQLLLSEVYQDQGRWSQSDELLKIVAPQEEGQSERLDTMRIIAKASLVESELQARELLEVIRKQGMAYSVHARVRLLSTTQRLALFLGDPQEARKELATARQLLPHLESLADRLVGFTAFTAFCWLTPGEEWSQEALDSLAVECERAGLMDSNVARLHRIRGCSLIALGQYAKAIQCFETALSLSKMHGDEIREADSADNLSLCYGRLGDYTEQEKWASHALKIYSLEANWWWRTRATLKVAYSLSMRGENRKALELTSTILSNPAGPIPPWANQASGLLYADILLLCGEIEKALQVANKTFHDHGYVVHTRSYCGPIARWASILAIRNNDAFAAALLDQLNEHLERHDTVDQAEILNAKISISRSRGRDFKAEIELLGEKLVTLPPAVGIQLSRLQPF